MIYPLPSNFGFNYVAVPYWQWLPIPQPLLAPVRDVVVVEPDPTQDIDEAVLNPPEEELPPADQEPVDLLELVFQGYQWQLVAQWHPFVNPGYDHLVDNDPAEILERGVRKERERDQLTHRPPTRHARLKMKAMATIRSADPGWLGAALASARSNRQLAPQRLQCQ